LPPQEHIRLALALLALEVFVVLSVQTHNALSATEARPTACIAIASPTCRPWQFPRSRFG
jgi:hypothetical protein